MAPRAPSSCSTAARRACASGSRATRGRRRCPTCTARSTRRSRARSATCSTGRTRTRTPTCSPTAARAPCARAPSTTGTRSGRWCAARGRRALRARTASREYRRPAAAAHAAARCRARAARGRGDVRVRTLGCSHFLALAAPAAAAYAAGATTALVVDVGAATSDAAVVARLLRSRRRTRAPPRGAGVDRALQHTLPPAVAHRLGFPQTGGAPKIVPAVVTRARRSSSLRVADRGRGGGAPRAAAAAGGGLGEHARRRSPEDGTSLPLGDARARRRHPSPDDRSATSAARARARARPTRRSSLAERRAAPTPTSRSRARARARRRRRRARQASRRACDELGDARPRRARPTPSSRSAAATALTYRRALGDAPTPPRRSGSARRFSRTWRARACSSSAARGARDGRRRRRGARRASGGVRRSDPTKLEQVRPPAHRAARTSVQTSFITNPAVDHRRRAASESSSAPDAPWRRPGAAPRRAATRGRIGSTAARDALDASATIWAARARVGGTRA